MPIRFLALYLAASLAAAGCQSSGGRRSEPQYPPIESSELGTMHNVVVSDGLWFGGTPSLDDLDLAKRRGIGRVIDLRTVGETTGDDLHGECQRLGLDCVDIGLREPEQISDAAVDEVLSLLRKDDGVKTLMYCGDGARCAMFFALHRIVNRGMPPNVALNEARLAGMHPGWPEAFVQTQVDRLQPSSSTN